MIKFYRTARKYIHEVIPTLSLLAICVSCIPAEQNELLVKGIESYDNEQYRTAIIFFSEAIEADPGNAELYYYRAKAKMKLDSCKEAINDYSKAIILDKTNKEFFINRGLANISC
ncbi:MAG: hypothetical protein ACHQLA_01985, partial [Ignavibacteriales bacterium]